MWHVRRHDALRTEDFAPRQSADLSADAIVRLAEEVAETDDRERAVALETLRGFVSRSRRDALDIPGAQDAADNRVPALEPIRLWAGQAVGAVSDASERVALRELDGGLGLIEDGELSSFAWHGDTTAVVPITDATTVVELTYTPSSAERRRRDFFYNQYAKALAVPRWWPWPEVEMSADVVGFISDTEGGSTLAAIEPRGTEFPRRYHYDVELPAQAAGFLVVKPLYRLAKNLRVRARDPLWPARLGRAERGHSEMPPRLEDAQPSEGRLIVLVHGLASTAAEMARMLKPLALNAARFEHDTFISIARNASGLRKLLEEHAETADEIILLCHSRGGLVARAAADLLPEEVARRTAIHTFGTPHTGTPLADFAPIVSLIHLVDFFRHPWDVVRAADRYVLPRTWRTPEGIEEMSPDDEFIDRMIRGAHKQVALLNSWGAEYRDGCGGAWWHRPFATACAGILSAPHDLIVPESSCLGAGAKQGPLDAPSTHFDYLGLEQIHDYLRRML
jgi:pimeloyl-ACP methyl ester carboxylesterase